MDMYLCGKGVAFQSSKDTKSLHCMDQFFGALDYDVMWFLSK